MAIENYYAWFLYNFNFVLLNKAFLSKNTSVISKYYDVLLMSFFEEISILA